MDAAINSSTHTLLDFLRNLFNTNVVQVEIHGTLRWIVDCDSLCQTQFFLEKSENILETLFKTFYLLFVQRSQEVRRS